MGDFPTFADLFRAARDEALSRNSNLTLEVIEREGTDANALIAAGVAPGDVVTGQLIRLSADLFLSSARGSALDKLVFDRYQLLRQPATPAVGEVTLTTTAPAAVGFSVAIGQKFRSTDNKTYEATANVPFLVGSSGPVTVPIQSVLTGLSQQARAGTITSAQIAGAPADLIITNTEATAGAADEEKDEQLRDRARKFYKTSQRGTLAAIQRAALGVAGVRTASAFEAVEADASPARIVELVVADQFTEQLVDATVLPGGYQTQSQQLSLNIQSALLETRAAGIQVLTTIGQVRILGITLLLRFRAGVNVAATTSAARARTVAYVNSLQPGASFVPGSLENALRGVPGLLVLGGEVASPAVEQAASRLQVWRTSPSNVVIGTAA